MRNLVFTGLGLLLALSAAAQTKRVTVTARPTSGTGTQASISKTLAAQMIRDSLGPIRAGKQNVEPGKGLSTYDFSHLYRFKLDNQSYLTGITAPGDMVSVRYYPLANLPVATEGTYDFIDIELVSKPWDNASGLHSAQRVYLANRGQFVGRHTATGEIDGVGIAAFRDSTGLLNIFVKADNAYRSFGVRVVNHQQAANIVQSLCCQQMNPKGTLVYDSSLPAEYPPLFRIGSIGDMNATRLVLPDGVSSRKLVMYATANNDHNFYGFGVNPNQLRYQTPSESDAHVWYSGRTPSSSMELMRLTGDGRLAIGSHNPPAVGTVLDVTGGWSTFYGNIARTKPGQGIGISLGWNRSGGLAENNLIWGHSGWPGSYLEIARFDGTDIKEQARFSTEDHFGVGLVPNYRLHVGQDNPANGYIAQFVNHNTGANGAGTGAKISWHYGGQSIWSAGIKADNSGFVINGWNGNVASPPEFLRISNSGSIYVANNFWAGGAFTMQTPGAKFYVTEGANAISGVVTLSGGTVTVSNTSVTANSRIQLTAQEGGTLSGNLRVSARNPGTGFTITSTNGGDTANVAYWIIN